MFLTLRLGDRLFARVFPPSPCADWIIKFFVIILFTLPQKASLADRLLKR